MIYYYHLFLKYQELYGFRINLQPDYCLKNYYFELVELISIYYFIIKNQY